MAKRTLFNYDWCDKELNPDWAKWLEPNPKSIYSAKCLACKRTFQLSNMGRQAIVSHEVGPKHQKNVKKCLGVKQSLPNFLKESAESKKAESVVTVPHSNLEAPQDTAICSVEAVSAHPKEISKYLLNDQVTKAEILWCLRTVMTHSSFRSNSDVPEILRMMFPDSDIAKKFHLKKDKTAYTICFGLAPFFKSELLTIISSLETFVICFDESLNKVIQKGQMDIHVRFWKNKSNTVTTRYLTSVFLGHSDAKSLVDSLKTSIPSSEMKKVLQLSMDGPNVNHKLHSMLQNDLKESSSKSLLDIGSCGLHIVHGAFKTGLKSTSWNLNKFLYDIFNLFKNSPARRADFKHLTGSYNFPLKFCSVRWVENVSVAQRALDILPQLRIFIQKAEAKKIEPDTKTYISVKEMLKCQELLEAKLGFFISVASELQGFLLRFQTSKPMAPFLYEEMYMILQSLMKRFVKSEIINQHNSALKLMKIDVELMSNILSTTDLNIGFAAKRSLQESKASDTLKLNFRRECRSFLQKMTLKLIERNPLRFKLVRGISCLSPNIISTSSSLITGRLDAALEVFMDCSQISSATADKVKTEFGAFISSSHVKKEISEFNCENDRLDILYYSLLSSNVRYQNLFAFVKNVLVISHGNATVESGFSVNKALLIENLQEKSVVALRTVYDSVADVGGLLNVDVSKRMILSARNAHSYYQEELEKKKLLERESKMLETKQKRAAEEIKDIKAKKLKIQQDADKKIAELDGLMKELQN